MVPERLAAVQGSATMRRPGERTFTMRVPILLLGPQRLAPTLGQEARDLGLRGPIAVITAGWQEREEEDDELRTALALPAMNLRLYSRWEDVQTRDPVFHKLHRAHQDRLRRIQELYRRRLEALMDSANAMWNEAESDPSVREARTHSVEQIRDLDEHHLRQIVELHEVYEDEIRPGDRPVVREHREEIEEIARGSEAFAIAGGHVAILLNRLRLFDLAPLLREKPVIAWSAGAMSLCDRVVLFHDHPPQGAGHAEVLDAGLRLCRGVVPFPHARHRLDLGNTTRVAITARRFAPAMSVPMNERNRVLWDGTAVRLGPGVAPLDPDGQPHPHHQVEPKRAPEPTESSVGDVPAPTA